MRLPARSRPMNSYRRLTYLFTLSCAPPPSARVSPRARCTRPAAVSSSPYFSTFRANRGCSGDAGGIGAGRYRVSVVIARFAPVSAVTSSRRHPAPAPARASLPNQTPPPPYSRIAMDDVKPKEHGESTEDARRTDHERLVTGSLATDGEERQSWEKEWCRLAYWELTQRVGRQFGVRVRAVDVFGGDGGACGSGRHGLCLDALDSREPQVEQVRKTRAKIGLGVTLSLESDGVWLYNRSQEPVFVSSPALDAAAAKALLVWRVAPGHCLCIFDPASPPPAISLPHVGPVDPRSVRISFAKGWGPKYSRRDVTACPCWLEVLLAPPS
ncbi:mothers against decapentaplegic homolog 6 isoform X1 [Epargyreus clarus]|uniref:mothers against decapentaplegic homolog 6 isoform X1 n=1 Tax=Epargyreus clarus TaxID=520877 RepID=UPI003C2BF895